MKTCRWLCLLLLALTVAAARPLAAQQTADIIRGRVLGPDSLPIPNVNVLVTSFMGGINKTARTDRNGRFSVVFPNGEGDYWVGFAAIGYTFKRFELKRLADEEILIADTRLERAAQRLDTVNVTTTAKRGTPPRVTSSFDVSGTEKSANSSTIGAGQAGNLAAMVGGLPGFQFIPGVDGNPDLFSVLGLSPDQNNTALNGVNGSAGDLPRDASTSVGATSSPWDVSRGGFSGAQVQISTSSGTNYLAQSLSSQFDTPSLQWTDKIGNSTGSQYTRMSGGARFGGPLTMDRSFYNFSVQYDRTLRDLQTLFNSNDLALQTAGISPDSTARLRNVLQHLGIPTTAPGVGNPTVDLFKQLGSFDFSPKAATSGAAYQISENFNYTRTAPTATSLLATPAYTGENRILNGIAVARHTNYFWSSILTQTWLTASLNSTKNQPNLAFPAANVRVSSELDDGTSAVRSLQFGGNSQLGQNSLTGVLGAKNQLSWYAGNNKHSLKLTTELRQDWYSRDNPANQLGTFSFQSLADLEAGVPSQFTRQLANLHEAARQMTGVVALGDAWRPSTNVQVVYGLRLDGNYFLTRPNYNSAVTDAVGVRNDRVPNNIYLVPRVGVSWTYGTADVIPLGEGYAVGPRATVRAGIGMYQNVAGADLIGSALNQTGLPGASRTLVCGGPAAPVPLWNQYATNPGAIPTSCADGSSVFASSLPSVTLFDKSYVQPRSLRANVNWSGGILNNRFTAAADLTYSLGLNQTGYVDLNFNPASQFTLANEGGRPVFVRPTSIDPASGVVATRDARISGDFSQIRSMRSDLRHDAGQVTLSIRPFFFNPTRFTWSASYTYQNVRDRFNGFSSTSGTPLDYAWGRASTSPHQIQYSLSYNFWDYVTVNWQGGFQSGMRFTPGVAGDINGDGSYGNDRAFVFDPATASDPALAAAMRDLITRGPIDARQCLAKQVGTIAARNSCTGPWTASSGVLSISLNSMKVWMPPRTRFTISVQNPLVAADLLFHGSGKLHGWGETPPPDASLLFVRGFNPATQQYKYEVNQRFGSTSLAQNTRRSPVIVTAGFSVDIGPTRDWQSMQIMLDRGRSHPGTKLTEAQIRSMSTALGVANPMSIVMRYREALRLTRKQADSISSMSRAFAIKLDSAWLPLAMYYNGLPEDFNHGIAHEKFVDARRSVADYLIKVVPGVKAMLTPAQWRKLAPNVGYFLEPRYLKMLREGLVSSGIGVEMMMMSMSAR